MSDNILQTILRLVIDKKDAKKQLDSTLKELNQQAKASGVEIPTNLKTADIQQITKEMDNLSASAKQASNAISEINKVTASTELPKDMNENNKILSFLSGFKQVSSTINGSIISVKQFIQNLDWLKCRAIKIA